MQRVHPPVRQRVSPSGGHHRGRPLLPAAERPDQLPDDQEQQDRLRRRVLGGACQGKRTDRVLQREWFDPFIAEIFLFKLMYYPLSNKSTCTEAVEFINFHDVRCLFHDVRT